MLICSEETTQELKPEFSEDEETLIIRMYNLVGERYPFSFCFHHASVLKQNMYLKLPSLNRAFLPESRNFDDTVTI